MLEHNTNQHPESFELRLRRAVARLEADFAEQRETEQMLRNEQALLTKLLDLKEQDRQLAAYDLHDGVAQMLAGAILHLQSFLSSRDQGNGKAESALQRVMSLLEESAAEIRRFICGVGLECVVSSGVVVAIRSFLFETEICDRLDIEFISGDRFDRLDPRLETALFRIVQESVNNAARHSQSAKVRVELIQNGTDVHVSVTDWGVGFDVESIAEDRLGLRGIRERAKLFGGQFRLETQPGNGVKVSVRIPVEGK